MSNEALAALGAALAVLRDDRDVLIGSYSKGPASRREDVTDAHALEQLAAYDAAISGLERLARTEFETVMARRFVERSDMPLDEALRYAPQCLEGFLTKEGLFDDNSHDWTEASAIELADEDMSYWEQA